MLKVVTRFFKVLALTVVFALSVLNLTPNIAFADTAVSFDASNRAVNVATIYDTNNANQANILADILKQSDSNLPTASGFMNASVLKSQDGTKVVTLSQWQNLPSFQAYTAKLAKEDTTKYLAEVSAPRTFVYEVKQTEAKDTVPAIHVNDNAVQFSEFRMKRPQDQPELLGIIGEAMPGVMQMEPGLQWVTLMRSLDNTNIALLAHWNSNKQFDELSQTPGYDQENGYWTPYAVNDHHLYDVVKIIS